MAIRLKYCRWCGELIFENGGRYCEDCQKLGKGKWSNRKQRRNPPDNAVTTEQSYREEYV